MPTGDQVRISVLGPIGAERAGRHLDLGSPKQRAVLAMLAARAGRVVDRDVLLAGVWGEDVDTGRMRSLHTYVSNLRALLGDVIERASPGYRLVVLPEEVDAVRFERVVADARTALALQPSDTADRLREALSWWRGRPYADLDGIPGLEAEIRRLEEMRLDAVELRIEADLASGRHEAVVAEVAALAEEHPTRERFRAQEMLALYRSNRQAEALSAYVRTERFLGEELGLDPSAELQALELAILQQDDSLLAASHRSVTQRVAFLITEIEDSGRKWDRHPQQMAAALALHDRLLTAAIESAGGRVFNQTGEGLVGVFLDARAAAEAAEAAQRALHAAHWEESTEIRVRMGIDVGDAESRGGGFTGPPLNRAGRLAAVGHGGQVLISSSARAEIADGAQPGVQVRQLGRHRLQGQAQPEEISQLVMEGLPASFPPLRRASEPAADGRTIPVSLPGYEVRDRIGEGAYGVVYRAYQPSVGREVAVKAIRAELSDHPSLVRRFEAEARTIARLAHPHIVPLIDFWRDPLGVYLVLQLLAGGSLVEAMGADMDIATSRRILGQVAAALDHAHSHGVVHGDVKPANVLLDGAGNAYLSDFGIVPRLLEPELVAALSTAPDFQAPELWATGPTTATDVFAFAVLVSRLMGGTAEVDTVLARAQANEPHDRHRSAGELLAEVDGVLGEVLSRGERMVVSRNPYRGLRAFEEGDAPDFHGRGQLVAALTSAVADNRFVTVVGPSGSGKSSLVQAGLLPAVAAGAVDGSEGWLRVVVTPTSTPIASLTEALNRVLPSTLRPEDLDRHGLRLFDDIELLLIVDQFEEIYTLVEDAAERARFVRLLVEAARPPTRVRTVINLRADFYDRPLEEEHLGRLVRDGLVTVLRPTRDDLAEMITAPAHAVGLRFEPGLVRRIVEDVADQPGALPLLQYALTELVERRGGDLLTSSGYERIGTATGAVAARAEALYEELNASEREVARQVFLRLVTVGEDNFDTRRRVRRSELESLGIGRGHLDRVLDLFTSERLLLADRDPVTRGPTVEVAHEALLREWPRLVEWIDERREALMLGRRFRSALADWEANDRHDDHLLAGNRLLPFTLWARTASLAADEREYFEASYERDQEQRRAVHRRRRLLIGVLAAAALISAVLGTVAVVQAGRAVQQATLAEESTRLARARELTAAAEATISSDPALAKLLALASIDSAAPTMDTISVLRRAMAADRVTARHNWPGSIDRMVAVALSPDGSLAAFAGLTNVADVDRLEVRDVASWSLLWSRETEGHGVDGLYFSPDSTALVMGMSTWMEGDFPLGVEVRDAITGVLVAAHPTEGCGPTVAGVSATHALIQVWPMVDGGCTWEGVVADPPASLELIDLRTGSSDVITASALDVRRPSLSGDGRYVAFGVEEQGARSVVVDVATGERLLDIDPATVGADDGFGRALNGDGTLLLAGDRPMVVIDVATGREVARFDEHGSRAHAAVFAGDGASVWSVGADGNVYQWDPSTGRTMAAIPGGGGSGHIRSSMDGSVVLVDDLNSRSMSVIGTRNHLDLWSVSGCAGGGTVLDDTLVLAGGVAAVNLDCGESTPITVVIDVENRMIASRLPGSVSFQAALSPQGDRLARQERAGTATPLRIRDPRTGAVVLDLAGRVDGTVSHIEWSPDGTILVARVGPGTVVAWDASTGAPLGEVTPCRTISDLVFTPDRSGLVVGCFEEPLAVVSTSTWDTVARPEVDVGHFPSFPGFTVDGSELLVLNAGTGSASMFWVDPSNWQIIDSIGDVHAGATTGWATSPSSLRAATASSDGFVKIWDLVTRRQIDEIFVGRQGARGVRFVDDDLVLIATADRVFAASLNPDELVAAARRTVTRGFTRAECDRYGFGDVCPTLDDLAREAGPG